MHVLLDNLDVLASFIVQNCAVIAHLINAWTLRGRSDWTQDHISDRHNGDMERMRLTRHGAWRLLRSAKVVKLIKQRDEVTYL